MKGGKQIDKFESSRFWPAKFILKQVIGGMIAEAYNEAAVQKTRWPGPSVSG